MKVFFRSLCLVLAMASAEAMIGGGIEKRGEAAGEIERHETSEDITAQHRRAEERCDMKMALSRGTESSAVDETITKQQSSCLEQGISFNNSGMDIVNTSATMPFNESKLEAVESRPVQIARESDDEYSDELKSRVPVSVVPPPLSILKPLERSGLPIPTKKKKVTWSESITVDPTSEFIDEIRELRATIQKAYDHACDSPYHSTYDSEKNNQYLPWSEAYHSKLRPAARRVIELVKVFPPEATFEKKKAAFNIAIGITQQTLSAALAGMRQSVSLKKESVEQKMTGIQEIEETGGKRELDLAILTFKGQLENDLDNAWSYFKKNPEEMRKCLADHQFVNEWNQKNLERLQILINEDQPARRTVREKFHLLLGWTRPKEEVHPSEEAIDVAWQQQQVIQHAITTCEQALALAELAQSVHSKE